MEISKSTSSTSLQKTNTIIATCAIIAIILVVFLAAIFVRPHPYGTVYDRALTSLPTSRPPRTVRSQDERQTDSMTILRFLPLAKYSIRRYGGATPITYSSKERFTPGDRSDDVEQGRKNLSLKSALNHIEDSPYQNQLTQGMSQVECPVCFEDFVENEVIRVLQCRHIFHQRCIDRWLLQSVGTCPVCRTGTLPTKWPIDSIRRPRPATLPMTRC